MSTDRTVYFQERQTVIDVAVNEATRWGRSWSDQWYYSLPPKDRELFYGGFKHFRDECEYAYKLALETIDGKTDTSKLIVGENKST